MLYREPKVLKQTELIRVLVDEDVSVLYREPKVLKRTCYVCAAGAYCGFSALP